VKDHAVDDHLLSTPEQRDEVRFEFRDVPPDQLPDFDQFINIERPSYQDFSRPEFFHEDLVCAQILTPARERLTGYCKVFPNSCLPPGWMPDQTCQTQAGAVDGSATVVPPPTQIQIAPAIDYQRLLEEKQRLLEQAVAPAPTGTTQPVDQIVCPSYDIMRFTQECSQKGGTVGKKFDPNCGYLPHCILPTISTEPVNTQPAPTEPAPTPTTTCPSYDIIAFTRDCSARGGSVVKKYTENCGYLPECVLPTATEPAPTYQYPSY
jgi:putative hemolysin